MGKRDHDVDAMLSSRRAKAASGTDAFDYSRRARSSSRGSVHPALHPAYGGLRYSNRPDPSTPVESVTVMFDVTGSNIEAAHKVRDDLPQLMGLLAVKGWAGSHLNLQIGGIGDATCDRFPLQLSQFEADGATIDRWLDLLILEGGGGGQTTESYELAMWALCNQNRLENWEHGGRGTLFMIFDEQPYRQVSLQELKEIYNGYSATVPDDGTELSESQLKRSLDAGVVLPQSNIPLKQIVAELHSKYDVYGIICAESGYYDNERILGTWEDMLGPQRIIKLPNADDISEMIAALMGYKSGISFAAIEDELLSLGTSTNGMDAISKALSVVGSDSDIVGGSFGPTGSSDVTRL